MDLSFTIVGVVKSPWCERTPSGLPGDNLVHMGLIGGTDGYNIPITAPTRQCWLTESHCWCSYNGYRLSVNRSFVFRGGDLYGFDREGSALVMLWEINSTIKLLVLCRGCPSLRSNFRRDNGRKQLRPFFIHRDERMRSANCSICYSPSFLSLQDPCLLNRLLILKFPRAKWLQLLPYPSAIVLFAHDSLMRPHRVHTITVLYDHIHYCIPNNLLRYRPEWTFIPFYQFAMIPLGWELYSLGGRSYYPTGKHNVNMCMCIHVCLQRIGDHISVLTKPPSHMHPRSFELTHMWHTFSCPTILFSGGRSTGLCVFVR